MTNASTSSFPAQTYSSLRAVCSRKDLFEGVQTVGHAVSGRSSLPILSHVLLQAEADTLRLSATDLELSISLKIPAYIEEPGGLTAHARILTELLGTLPEGDVAITGDSSHAMHLHCGRSSYKLLGLPAEEYPRLPEVKEENQFWVAQSLLREMIRQTIFAVSTDEARAILTGILMVFEGESLQLVSTDTHRLALRSTRVREGQGARQAIVPARAMNELLRILTDAAGDVEVRLS
ncbi:MAG TPA: DNA polymerase III subunit beta, partial [Chthonomonadales bacterium]|nr:DNA polymerase III subunit beta [Chthonomonadales bacterium]